LTITTIRRYLLTQKALYSNWMAIVTTTMTTDSNTCFVFYFLFGGGGRKV